MTPMKLTQAQIDDAIMQQARHLTHICGVCGAETDQFICHVDCMETVRVESCCGACIGWCIMTTTALSDTSNLN